MARFGLLMAGVLLITGPGACTGTAERRGSGEHSGSPVGADAALIPFAGLAGVWRAPSGTGFIEEVWLPPAGGNLTGALRRLDAMGNATMLELLTLTAEPDGVRFRIRHMDAQMKPWSAEAEGPMVSILIGSDGGVLVFEPEARAGRTTRMIYDLSTPDLLKVTLLFGEAREPLVIPFERVR